jgi:hypothetical protein
MGYCSFVDSLREFAATPSLLSAKGHPNFTASDLQTMIDAVSPICLPPTQLLSRARFE